MRPGCASLTRATLASFLSCIRIDSSIYRSLVFVVSMPCVLPMSILTHFHRFKKSYS